MTMLTKNETIDWSGIRKDAVEFGKTLSEEERKELDAGRQEAVLRRELLKGHGGVRCSTCLHLQTEAANGEIRFECEETGMSVRFSLRDDVWHDEFVSACAAGKLHTRKP